MGQFHHGPLMGQELQRDSYGSKDVMGHIRTMVTLTLLRAVGSMGLLWAIDKWASNRALESVGLGPSDKWIYMGRKRA